MSNASSNSDSTSLPKSEGGGIPWTAPADHPVHLAAALERVAREQAGRGIRYLDGADGTRQTYPELRNEATVVLAGLRDRGLKPGQPVIFQLSRNRDFLTAFWACSLGGYVPVPVTISPTYEQHHSILAKLKNAWAMLGKPPILSGAELAPRLEAFARRDRMDGFRVERIDDLRGYPPAEKWHEAQPDDLALLLLTSGSTGLPKAVRQTHRRLLAWAASAGQACEFSPEDVSLNWMPLDHVGGLVMFHLRDLVTGCEQIHAPTEAVLQNPLSWLDWIECYKATITWAPNFAYGLVNDQAAEIARRHWDLSSMRFILNGGEAIVSKTARRFLEMLAPHRLPVTSMRPAWGMSETCSGVTYSRRFTLDLTTDADPFVEVGEPIPGITLRIVDHANVPVAEGKIGHLQIKGISVTDGYHENREANQKSFTPDGWYVTGDLGTLKQGRLTITGREKDVIIINGVNFYSHEIEAAVEELAGVEVSFTAACPIRLSGEDTDRIAIFFTPQPGIEVTGLIRQIRSAVAQKEGVTPDFIVPLPKDEIPKTAIGKIQRSQLKERFERGEFSENPAGNEAGGKAGAVLLGAGWREEVLPGGSAGLPGGSHLLIFADDLGLGAELGRQVKATGRLVTLVEAGGVFARMQRDYFKIDPHSASDVVKLLEAVGGLAPITHVVHAWTYPKTSDTIGSAEAIPRAQQHGALGLLRLLREWPMASEDAAPVRFLVVTSRLNSLGPKEPVDWVKAAVLGVARTIPHEYAGLDFTLMDLEGAHIADDVRAVAAELAVREGAREVCVRAGGRHVPTLVRLKSSAERKEGFRDGGLYVISGGLGGIGRVVAHYLTEAHRANVLLLGRAPLPLAGAEERILAQGGAEAERVRAWKSFEPTKTRVRYEAGDLTDPEFVKAAVERAKAQWAQPVDGILHLAGEYHEAVIAMERDEGFFRSLTPKLAVAWSLHQVAGANPDCEYIHFSSVLGHFSAMGMAAYASANASLDAFVRHQRNAGIRSRSLNWSLWKDTGMGRGYEADEAMKLRGYLQLPPAAALQLLEQAMTLDAGQIFVGLDVANRNIRKLLDPAEDEVANSGSHYTAPRTELEQRMVAIWQEVLKLPRVGVTDNFFEIGGRSLLAAQLFARIGKELGQTLPIATLFKAPTIESLCALLQSTETPSSCRALAIHAKGELVPFFCIPGGGSDVIVFQDLSRALGGEQPFYGLQARGLDAIPIEGPFPSVEEVAADFIKAMKAVQPKGPYQVGGHCFGSLLAWEVARQLEAAGEQVGLLALLDPIVSNVLSEEILGGDRLRYHLRKFWKLSFRKKFGYFAEKVRNFSRTLVVRQRIGQSYEQARSMHSRYQMGEYKGPVLVFMANDSFFRLTPATDPRRYYERLAKGGVRYLEVTGDHHSILHEPGVAELAAGLKAALANSQKNPQTDPRSEVLV